MMKQITAHELTAMSEQAASVAACARTARRVERPGATPGDRHGTRHLYPPAPSPANLGIADAAARFVVLQFNDDGVVTQRTLLGEETKVLEMPAFTWHAVLSVDAGGVVFEVKQGPYQALTEEDCMQWAPQEGTEAVMRWYATAQVGDRYPH